MYSNLVTFTINVKFFAHVASNKRPSTNKNTGQPTCLLINPPLHNFTSVYFHFFLQFRARFLVDFVVQQASQILRLILI